MEQVFKGRSFLAEKDFTKAELEYLIDFSIYLKQLKKQNISHRYLEGKNIALLFEKNIDSDTGGLYDSCHRSWCPSRIFRRE